MELFSLLVLLRLLPRRRVRPRLLVAEHVATAPEGKPQDNPAKVFTQVSPDHKYNCNLLLIGLVINQGCEKAQ